jgi:hypothetical protein
MFLAEAVLRVLRNNLPAALMRAHRRHTARKFLKSYEEREFFADTSVDLRSMSLFRRDCFPESGPTPWLDRPDAEEQIEARLGAGEISEEDAYRCRFFRDNGFLILERFHDPDFLDETWDAVDQAIGSGKIPVGRDSMTEGGEYEDRFQDLHARVPELNRVLACERTIEVLALLLGKAIRPFQTLVFYLGSEQMEHSDSVHMTTYPDGYLAATWTAMEDVGPESGPLIYYPGSHRLPYQLSHESGISHRESLCRFSKAYHSKYEPFVQELIRREGLEPVLFTPKKGDMLIWHANLLHGGMPRQDRELSRRSVVCHYFAQGAICYHDISGALAHP